MTAGALVTVLVIRARRRPRVTSSLTAGTSLPAVTGMPWTPWSYGYPQPYPLPGSYLTGRYLGHPSLWQPNWGYQSLSSLPGGLTVSKAALPPCAGNAGPGCTCTGDCGGNLLCLCRPCIARTIGSMPLAAPARPAIPAVPARPARPVRSAQRKGPRHGGAGIPGFDGQGEADFALAVGRVHGIRQWNYEVNPGLHSALGRDVAPSASLLLNHEGKLPLLRGVNQHYWEPGHNEAVCSHVPGHKPPVEFDEKLNRECGCGFWAYWTVDARSWSNALPVWGVIEGTGRVLLGEKGFRCQRARIIALTLGFTIEPRVYGVPGARYGSFQVTDAVQPEAPAELEQARQRADAWMAVLMDGLGVTYPEARVFATVKGMLASFPLGEVA